MKTLKPLLTLFLCLFLTVSWAQNKNQCVHCKMDVNDELHRALAEKNNETLHFDAIECLINYLKNNDEDSFSTLKVADYNSGDMIDAKNAVYLKSKAIPSPMGANLSAFKTEEAAKNAQGEKAGEIFSWSEIKLKFKESKFGAVDHSHHNHNKADAYAPSGIMGDHLHPKGGLMVSLKHMYMKMDGNLDGNSSISNENIFSQYMVAPQSMSMQMYMLGIMYAPSDNITLMLMQNIIKKDMDLKAMMMMNRMTMFRDFSTASNGLGDMKISALFGLYSKNNSTMHINTAFNIPIGSLDNTDDTPMMQNAKLPYAMQLGSGTFDATLGVTYKGNSESWSWGIQLLNTFRTGKNNEDYRLGNLHELNTWLSYGVSDNFSTSLRLSGSSTGKIKGEDPELNPMMVTTTNTSNYGGELMRSALGINFLVPNTKLLFCIEAALPLYQNYNGVFMDENFSLNTAIKYTIL